MGPRPKDMYDNLDRRGRDFSFGSNGGAVYMVSMITAVPRLGTFTTFAAIGFGQLATALAMDAAGGFGLDVQPLSWQCFLALVLMMAGIVLSRWH